MTLPHAVSQEQGLFQKTSAKRSVSAHTLDFRRTSCACITEEICTNDFLAHALRTHLPCRFFGDDFIVLPHLEVPAAGCGGQEACFRFTGTLAQPSQHSDVCLLMVYQDTETPPNKSVLFQFQYRPTSAPKLPG